MRKWILVVGVFFLSLQAQAIPLPVRFFQAMEQSNQGSRLLSNLRSILGEERSLAEIASAIESRPALAAFREELHARALWYSDAYLANRLRRTRTILDPVTAGDREKLVAKILTTINDDELFRLARAMDSRFEAVGLYPLNEFPPRPGRGDLVGMARRRGKAPNLKAVNN